MEPSRVTPIILSNFFVVAGWFLVARENPVIGDRPATAKLWELWMSEDG